MFGGLKVITVTDRAAERIREIVEGGDAPARAVRIGVKNGGCAGMSYTLDRVDAIDTGADVVEHNGATVVIDPKATLFLLGTEMDFEVSKLSSGFVFNNPNQTGACGCGESVSLTPAKLPEMK